MTKWQLAVSNGTRGGYGGRWGTVVRWWGAVKKGFVSAPQTRYHAIHCRALFSSCEQNKRVAWLCSRTEQATCAAEPSRGGGKSARRRGWWLDVGRVQATTRSPQALLVHQPSCSTILLHARATPGIAFDALPCGGHEVSQLRRPERAQSGEGGNGRGEGGDPFVPSSPPHPALLPPPVQL